MRSLPIFLKLDGREVLLVGDNEAALAKLRLLAKTPASILALAPNDPAAFAEFADHPRLTVEARSFTADDVKGKALVYADAGDDAQNEFIAATARAAGVPVNIVDTKHLCDFITPAIVDREPLTVAISTDGEAPVLGRRLRAMIEGILPADFGRLASLAGGFRDTLKQMLPDGSSRRHFWDLFFDFSTTAELSQLDDQAARRRLLELANRQALENREGRVLLVGAGPGDPELLTLKAHRALQHADVIVYDNLVNRQVLDYARRDADFIFVGKRAGQKGAGQDDINRILIEHARAGKLVVRLKSGDPLIFGRAGEEIDALRAEGIATEVVPGITALTGCAAGSLIPLTHRDHSSAVTLITGHLKGGSAQQWRGLAGEARTLAVYMGLNTASDIADGLIADGLSPDMPVAIIENGSRSDERRLYSTLADLPTVVTEQAVASPALIVIGDVVALASDFSLIEPRAAMRVAV